MKKSRKVFWFIFCLYFLMAIISAFVADYYQNDLGFLISMKGYIPLVKYFFLFGFILFGLSYIFMRMNFREYKKEVDKYETEKKTLKAKLFDLQEEYNEVLEPKTSPSTNISESNSEEPKVE